MAACGPYLEQQIALLQPKLIIALGAVAARYLLQDDAPLWKVRGREHSYHGIPLVVTYHPAYLLSKPSEKRKAWEDWRFIADFKLPPR
jgi:DNA polymerase